MEAGFSQIQSHLMINLMNLKGRLHQSKDWFSAVHEQYILKFHAVTFSESHNVYGKLYHLFDKVDYWYLLCYNVVIFGPPGLLIIFLLQCNICIYVHLVHQKMITNSSILF